jgi:hypothetical protein
MGKKPLFILTIFKHFTDGLLFYKHWNNLRLHGFKKHYWIMLSLTFFLDYYFITTIMLVSRSIFPQFHSENSSLSFKGLWHYWLKTICQFLEWLVVMCVYMLLAYHFVSYWKRLSVNKCKCLINIRWMNKAQNMKQC